MAQKIEVQLLDLNTKDILIDDLGQRDVNRRRAQFNKIMRTFDPNLVQPISVALIDGKYYCFDGQMTMKVLKARNAGRDHLYASYIRVIKQSWHGDPPGAQAQILRGLGLFMRTYKGQFKEDVLIDKLQKKHPNDIVRDAQVDRSSGARKYAVQILLTYNFSQREQNRLPNLL